MDQDGVKGTRAPMRQRQNRSGHKRNRHTATFRYRNIRVRLRIDIKITDAVKLDETDQFAKNLEAIKAAIWTLVIDELEAGRLEDVWAMMDLRASMYGKAWDDWPLTKNKTLLGIRDVAIAAFFQIVPDARSKGRVVVGLNKWLHSLIEDAHDSLEVPEVFGRTRYDWMKKGNPG